ncbi:MAG: TiaS agmantine-binding domain-containing protein [Candidatus Heimdallarchaeota archaeon]
MSKILHIGFDDTDSIKGSCTTYLATNILNEIHDQITFLDFPNLIRLNPNIPYKTRGNGAVALRIKGLQADLEHCKEVTIRHVEKFSVIEDENTNPGIAFVSGDIPSSIKQLSQRALWDVITISEASHFDQENNIQLLKYKNGRGIIGALGAIGCPLHEDFTYEHLSYRQEENFGTKRKIDAESVYQADKVTPLTINNIDYEYKAIMITPRGADPVFVGIRGETVESVTKMWSLVKPLEPISKTMVFRTNQHTNQHFVKSFAINELQPHLSIITNGEVAKKPYYIEGSHLIFSITDETGQIDCAAYEPTKRYRKQLAILLPGDQIRVFGGVRPASEKHPMTINLEQLQVESLIDEYSFENPFCDKCNSRLKSAGKNKGYKCFKCSAIFRDKKPIKNKVERKIKKQKYIPPIVAHRHLTKPLSRYDKDNTGKQLTIEETNKKMKELMIL